MNGGSLPAWPGGASHERAKIGLHGLGDLVETGERQVPAGGWAS